MRCNAFHVFMMKKTIVTIDITTKQMYNAVVIRNVTTKQRRKRI